MKKLEMSQMENVEGGKSAYDYCSILGGWVISGGEGYQGNINDVYYLYVTHCMD